MFFFEYCVLLPNVCTLCRAIRSHWRKERAHRKVYREKWREKLQESADRNGKKWRKFTLFFISVGPKYTGMLTSVWATCMLYLCRQARQHPRLSAGTSGLSPKQLEMWLSSNSCSSPGDRSISNTLEISDSGEVKSLCPSMKSVSWNLRYFIPSKASKYQQTVNSPGKVREQ